MIIVTGAAGFIGYQVVKTLEDQNATVICVDELDLFANRPEHTQGPFAARYKWKLAPETILAAAFFEQKKAEGTPVTGIIHMGACSATTEMRLDYLQRVNTDYTKTLWNLCTQFSIPFVYASSAATYGAGEQGYDDDESKIHSLKPLNPYGDSKAQFDSWALAEEKAGRHPPAWSGFKFFNVYGFGERHKEKMSSVVLQGFDQIVALGKLKLFKSHRDGIADGEQKRDFVYIDDVVDVLLFALKMPLKRGIYNLGSGHARSFFDLARSTFQTLGQETKIEFIDTPIAIRDRYQYFTEATMSKLKAAGYSKPFTSLEAGVKKTVIALQQFHDFQQKN
jgi:ADP-L-glycero-D-manno-heptose 6-epimerase